MGLFSRKKRLEEVGFFEGLTDMHSHILPGVDDGIKEMEDSLTVLKKYEEWGVTTVWCTPHVYEDLPNATSMLQDRFEQLKKAYKGGIKLMLAAEYMLDHELMSRLEKDDLLPIGDDRDHLLVETSFFNGPENLGMLFEQILSKGFYPILAHPERYIYMGKDDYKKWKEKKVKLQLNYSALAGLYGGEAQDKAVWLLENEMYDACGSDIHKVRFVADEKMAFNQLTIKSKLGEKLSRLKQPNC